MGGAKLVFAGSLVTVLLSTLEARAAEPEREREVEAEEEVLPRPLLAIVAGAATSFASLTAGAMVIARSRERDVKNAGLLGAQTGLCLSPIVAHAIVGEYKRGLFFALFPLAAEAGTATLMAFLPNFIMRAPPAVQYTTFGLITASIFTSTYGVLDAVWASERRPAPVKATALSRLNVSVVFDRAMTGAVVGGSL